MTEQHEDYKFTLHLMFCAKDMKQALLHGEQYAQALNELRPEVDCYQARVSTDDWSTAVPIYCLAPGPHPADVCLKRAKHNGEHAGPGYSDRWAEDQIPTAPDTIEGIEQATRDDGKEPDGP